MNHIADVSLKGTLNACQSELAHLKERIAAAEEMAKRLEDLIEVIGLDRDTRSAQYAIAAWNALK